ncbi:MAG: condensation domain-containing protein, partial [Jatrophihabitantaceae bacterium]
MPGPTGSPVQVIDPLGALELPVIELTGADPAAAVRQRSDELAVQPFELATGPLLRTELLRVSATEHVLLIVVHHIVFDAWSYDVLLRELTAGYRAAVLGVPAELPVLAVQLADYALWERQQLAESGGELIEFWRGALAGIENLQLPTDRPRPVLESFRGRIRRHRLGERAGAEVQQLARQQGSTAFVVLLAALQALLSRYTGQRDIVVGAPSANRSRSRLQPLIGFLVNTLPMRTDLSGDPSFLELIERVRRGTVAAYAHQELPLARLVEAIGAPRDPGRSPIFNVLLTSGAEPAELVEAGLRWRLERIDLPAAKFDLAFFAETCADGLWLEVSYASDLFDEASIDRLLGHFGELLAGALTEPTLRLSELPLLTEAELFDELVGWNATESSLARPAGASCLHELFQARAAASPDAPAATMAGQTISYRQLDQRSNQLARWLLGRGLGRQQLVGVAMQPSLDRLAVLIAILKAGAGYLPLDPALPADRLEFMVSDAGAGLVLADDPSEIPGNGACAIADVLAALADLDCADLAETELRRAEPVRDSDVAYLIYTSGSTGQPKGVLVEHRQVVNFALGMIEHWQFGGADRVLQFASLSFDVSVLDMFCCLLAGGCAVLVDRTTRLSPPLLGELMRRERVTLCCLPPVLLGLLADQDFPD